MQVTIDSQEPLDRVLRVVGALYGVELAVAPAAAAREASPDASSAETTPSLAAPPSPARRRSATGSRPRRSAAGRAARATARAGGAGGARTGRRRTRPAGEVDRAAVRDWARAHGYEVRDRGRVPNAVLEAYRQSASG